MSKKTILMLTTGFISLAVGLILSKTNADQLATVIVYHIWMAGSLLSMEF